MSSKDSSDFEIGQSVFLKTDIAQYERIVTGIYIRPEGITYTLVNETTESYHYSFEISSKINLGKKLGFNNQ
ncbi:MAG TPA: hypothetical protein DCS19_01570 [Flavobacterium sp.]|nr:hypothetical protein [Flavobacterium sp.]